MADKDAVQEVMEAFTEFKKTNDANIEKRSAAHDEKLDKISVVLDKFEPMNQKLVLADQQNKAMQEQLDRMETLLNRPDLGGADVSDKENKEFAAAFNRVMRNPSDQRAAADVQLIQRRAALVAGNDAGAGYLLAPPEMQAEIIKNVIEFTPMRSLATVRTIGSQSLKQPKRTGTGAASRVGETNLRANTGDPTYGMIEIHAPEMFARMEISQQMLEDSAYDLMAELREDAAEQFAVREGSEYIIGTGAASQAEGILTNADVGTTNSGAAASITANGMLNLYYDIKTAHSKEGIYCLNRLSLKSVRTLVDGEGRYLWEPNMAKGIPNTINGAMYCECPDMPNEGANAYPVVFGNIRRAYVIVDRVAISFQVDYTTGADNGLVVFRARKRTGGGVRQAEALRKLKCAA